MRTACCLSVLPLVQVVITGDQVHHSKVIPALLKDGLNNPLATVTDKAYGSVDIRRRIVDDRALVVIPSKSNARHPIPHDENLQAMRNIVERFFCKMKAMRRLATRFEN